MRLVAQHHSAQGTKITQISVLVMPVSHVVCAPLKTVSKSVVFYVDLGLLARSRHMDKNP